MLPIHIAIRDFPTSPALEEHIREKAEKLLRFCSTITQCHVVVELAQKHKHQGKLFAAHVDLHVPGKEFAVHRKENEDVYLAVDEAFDAIKQQLKHYMDRQKDHQHLTHAERNALLSGEEEGEG